MKKINQLLLYTPVIVLALIVVGCIKSNSSASQANGAAANIASSGTAATPAPASQEDNIPRTKVLDAKKEVADGKAVIIDVRGAEAYKMMHIKGSLDIPLQQLENKDFKGVPKDKHVIAYCT